MKKEVTRRHLLDSAARLVDREGGSRLTLDAVAQEATVSKGCVLYHFATKNALIEGMVEDLILRFEADLDSHLQKETGPGRWIRAYIQASFPHDTFLGRVSAGVFAAIASEPEMLRMARERFMEWQQRLEQDGVDPIDATIARLATDGLWFSGALGFAPPEAALRAQVVQRLIESMTPVPTPSV